MLDTGRLAIIDPWESRHTSAKRASPQPG